MSRSGIFRAFFSIVSASVTAAALLGAAPARAVTIDVPCAGTWNWNPSTQTLSCAVSPPSGPGVPSCTLAANPLTLPAGGGAVALTATCTNSPTSYQWSGTGLTGGATTVTNTNNATISATTSFSVTATNETGTGQSASRSVQVGAVVGGLSCPGFAKTLFVNWDWASSLSKVDTYTTQGGLGTNGILVIPFTPTGPADNVMVQLSATNYPASNMVNSKRLAISTQPCDLNPSAAGATAQGSSPSLSYVVGTAPVNFINGQPTGASLTPGVQYYINIAERNGINGSLPNGNQTCIPGGTFYPNCELRLTLQKPSGH